MNKYKSLFSNTLIFGVGNFMTKLIYFFLMPIYTLALTTEEFGLADLLNNSLQLVMPVFTLSITDAVFRFALDKEINHRLLLCNGLKILGYSYIIVLLLVSIIRFFSPHNYWIFFAILYVLESLKTLLAQFARGVGKIKEFALNGILGAIFLLGSTYFCLQIFQWGINGYLIAFIIANIVSIIYLLWKVDIKSYMDFSLCDRVLLRNMIIYSLPLIPNMLSWWMTNISSRYIIAGYCGLGIAGLFAGASKIPALINVVASVFQQAWQFASVKEYQESTKSEFYSRVFYYYSFFVIMISSVTLVALPYLSRFILKGRFYEAWIYTPLLLFSATLGCYSIFFGTFYAVVKDNKKTMYTTLVGAIVNILICFMLIPLIGVVGALIANVVSYVVIVGMRIRDARQYIYIVINRSVVAIDVLFVFCQAVVLSIPFSGHIYISAIVPVVLVFVHRSDLKGMISFLHTLKSNG
ncbi:polysaccharide biosynthesis C-terminal domain-containing protein [Bacteroides fragilis]|uniref:oligosaccharide flippase family protein n=1 Tax=Bacteroides fragilis TaxID=817 RepID=UPI0010CAA25A|nr:polysaccharide biosynthesis C-terminal domain-containing protein [Bacteroides fragilis]MCB6710277.1 polysaccharide biosynthesis C-terminal domain-containing protein [Bacteroides fragilis]MCE9170813.1 polysaccharide biosynthesis C-terminal domain-containing protein [Bacteroides fragilis]MCE9339885.1 polysaccharide biosynthesis C-terminal domain-containing protein [Bacteroides fragilis]MCQ5035758.1 polysaccharide biosynthesis C-terminal domain-containing protein [Bacteroides fragilis]MCQ50487